MVRARCHRKLKKSKHLSNTLLTEILFQEVKGSQKKSVNLRIRKTVHWKRETSILGLLITIKEI